MDMKETIGWKRPNRNGTLLGVDAVVKFNGQEIGKVQSIEAGGEDRLATIKMQERFGTGILNTNGIATISPFAVGGVEEYSIDNGRLKPGQRTLMVEKEMNAIFHMSVYRNGINLIEGHDYSIQGQTIELRHPVTDKDDDIEVRMQYFNGGMAERVLLLSSSLIPEDQLENFMPEYGDVFDINKLIGMNPLLVKHAGYKGRCVKAAVTEHGILGDLQLFKEETD